MKKMQTYRFKGREYQVVSLIEADFDEESLKYLSSFVLTAFRIDRWGVHFLRVKFSPYKQVSEVETFELDDLDFEKVVEYMENGLAAATAQTIGA